MAAEGGMEALLVAAALHGSMLGSCKSSSGGPWSRHPTGGALIYWPAEPLMQNYEGLCDFKKTPTTTGV